MDDLISRKALCDYALNQKDKSVTPNDIMRFPSAQPDDRLAKIAALVEGTIDHFDLNDAMDLLYQIKEVLK